MDELTKVLIVHTRNKPRRKSLDNDAPLPRVKNILFLFANRLSEGIKLFAANRDVKLVVIKATKSIDGAARLVGYIRANSRVPIIGIVLHQLDVPKLMSAGCTDCIYDAKDTVSPILFSVKRLQSG